MRCTECQMMINALWRKILKEGVLGARGSQFYTTVREHFLIRGYLRRKLKEVKEQVVKINETNVPGRGKNKCKYPEF